MLKGCMFLETKGIRHLFGIRFLCQCVLYTLSVFLLRNILFCFELCRMPFNTCVCVYIYIYIYIYIYSIYYTIHKYYLSKLFNSLQYLKEKKIFKFTNYLSRCTFNIH